MSQAWLNQVNAQELNRCNLLAEYAQGLGQQLGHAGLAQQVTFNNWRGLRDMTASDLGIVDQNLDDKVGMEP